MSIDADIKAIRLAVEKIAATNTTTIPQSEPPAAAAETTEPEVVPFTFNDFVEACKPFTFNPEHKPIAYALMREHAEIDPGEPDPLLKNIPESCYSTLIPALRAATP